MLSDVLETEAADVSAIEGAERTLLHITPHCFILERGYVTFGSNLWYHKYVCLSLIHI